MEHFNMYIPTRVVFGAGELNNLHKQVIPGKKALVVISNGRSTRANGYLERTEEQLRLANMEYILFDQVEANPLVGTVMAGSKKARENSCDVIVALGGGSVLDAAKAIAVVATNDGDYWDYIFSGTGKGRVMEHRPLPIVAIPTTAGTGSETDSACVVTNDRTNEKTGFGHPSLYPTLAVIDPELMLTVPPAFTAYQGFDALFHSIEGYVSNRSNPMSDLYALEAIENVSRYLPTAVNDGNDLEARSHVALGSYLSGVVMCVGGVTSQHSLEHAMSAYHQHLPHGAGLILISRAYFSHLIETHACDNRFIQMARTMGMSDATNPKDFIAALEALKEKCGVANLKMSDYGICPEEASKFTTNAKETMGRLFTLDRIPLSDADCQKIYNDSYKNKTMEYKEKPKVICHMESSVDGRLVVDRWTAPFDGKDIDEVTDVYTRIKNDFHAGAWILGRKSAQMHFFPSNFSCNTATPIRSSNNWADGRKPERYFVIIDPNGRIEYDNDRVGGDSVIAVLGERLVSEEYLAHLRRQGISYLFAGADGTDLHRALEVLYAEFGIKLILLDGGGITNGLFLKAGLIDELSLVLYPGIDGKSGISSTFEYKGEEEHPAMGQALELLQVQPLEDGVVWLRYKFHHKQKQK